MIKFTENILTYRKRVIYIKKEKHKKLHPLADWFGAFLWAAVVVLLINQFLLQAYVIPSKSMEKTLIVGDRVLVNKFIYGPELLPGLFKLPGLKEPQKNDVVIFENPEYLSKGAFFDLFQRLLFMLTLSVVDIDKDTNGNPAHHFLIKRAAASNGDTVKFDNGELWVKHFGEGEFHPEIRNNFDTQRLLTQESYIGVDSAIRSSVYEIQNSSASIYYDDLYFSQLSNYKYLSNISPSMLNYYQGYNKRRQGIFIPQNWFLPLGDNRDNSKDGRYFGVVHKSEILGKADLKFWPFSRIGKIR